MPYLFPAISDLPLWATATVMLVVSTLVAGLAPWLVRRGLGFERLVVNNEVAGFQYATLGTIYAILQGLAAVAVWDDYSGARATVEAEAAALINIDRLADGVPEPGRSAVRRALREYANSVIEHEWPAMRRGESATEPREALRRLGTALLTIEVQDQRAAVLYDHVLSETERLLVYRRERLDLIAGSLPPLVGSVLYSGAVITIAFTLFFAGRNVASQSLMTALLCLMVMLVLFVTVELNYPFGGGINVDPGPFQRMLEWVGPP